ncbi:MAG TPA: TolC family protein [Verrucomicrobiae bacterium]|jgi:TolC family type I secretion outer membrane protein|nr:TolC family protein [Verrucomicrobiae bacterium]
MVVGLAQAPVFAQANSAAVSSNSVPSWITRPLSLMDALNLTLQQNSVLQKARADLEASRGLVIQTRTVALPNIRASGNYTDTAKHDINTFPSFNNGTNGPTTNSFVQAHQNWDTQIRITQNIYQGGRTLSAFRAARLEKEQAMFQYQTAVADELLATRVAYYDVLVAEQQITVNEASVALLNEELQDQQRRYDAGTVPRFNVLQAQVAVANARPPLINARNAYRIAKNNLSNLLGYNLPRNVWEDIPLVLTDKLDATPFSIELPAAISQALERRTELQALQRTEGLQRENVINARSGYKPTIDAFAAYDWHNDEFSTDIGKELNGWLVGGELSWNIFDGLLTHGKVIQAKAQLAHAKADLEDNSRQIELEVRTDYSGLIEAREVLESQQKVQEEADEALRLARARADAGTGTRLDVLNAETQLTQARTTQVQALHDYDVARARFERAIGQDMIPPKGE